MKEALILIPTFNRPSALALTLASLAYQDYKDFDVIISDQSDQDISGDPLLQSVRRILETRHHKILIRRNLPRRGMAQQRQFLLSQSTARYSLFLDDDVVLEPWALPNMAKAIKKENCGFVGNAVIGLSFKDEVRPQEQTLEFWEGKVKPERISPGNEKWQRHKLHNAANLLHAAERLKIHPDNPRTYKVAWIGGCVLYDTKKLKQAGGFGFWKDLPKEHAGEDVLAQLRVMEKFGGCGLVPSGAFHLELPTTVKNRQLNAPEHLLTSNG